MTQGSLIKEAGAGWEETGATTIKDSAENLTIQYRYNSFGRKIAKTVTQGATSHTTYYINFLMAA